jgi:hypothetical protein
MQYIPQSLRLFPPGEYVVRRHECHAELLRLSELVPTWKMLQHEPNMGIESRALGKSLQVSLPDGLRVPVRRRDEPGHLQGGAE